MSTTPYTSPYGAEGTTQIPGGSQYARAALLANQQYKQRLSDLNRQRQQTMISSGYTGEIDPTTGLLKNFGVDPTSKYGGYQLLNRGQYQQGEEVYAQNIERGLGTGGGLAAQNLGNARFDWGRQDADFARGVQDQFSAFDRTQMDYMFDRDQALYNAELQAAQDAIGAGDYGSPGGGDDGYSGDDPSGAQDPAESGGNAAPLLPPGVVRRAVRKTFAPKKRPARKQVVATQRWAGGKVAKVVNTRPAKKKAPAKKAPPGKYRAWGPR